MTRGNDGNTLFPDAINTFIYIYIYISISGVGRCQKVWGHTDTYSYGPSVKNQYKRDVIGYMVIYVTAISVSLLKFFTG